MFERGASRGRRDVCCCTGAANFTAVIRKRQNCSALVIRTLEPSRVLWRGACGQMRWTHAFREDLAEGHRPLCVIASAGTVNTGAIDPLDEIADVCTKHNVWLHVDGAYGAPAILSRKYASQLKAL